jgi:peptidoglycan-N-acetylglucosamine deacetylase
VIDFLAFFAVVALVAAAAALLWRRAGGRPRSARTAVLRGVACIVVAFIAVGIGAWKLSNARTVQLLGSIVPRVETSDSVIALTFDDGPLPAATERVLAALAAADVRATFFLNGSAIEQHADAARSIVDEGHEIGNHSFSHPMMVGLSLRRIRDEIDRTDAAIRAIGYDGPIHFRSPYGKKLVALPYILATSGRSNIFWDVEPESWPEIARSTDRIVEHVLANARPGSIILMHVMTRHYEPSLHAVPAILDGLKARGYRFVTVSELLALRD